MERQAAFSFLVVTSAVSKARDDAAGPDRVQQEADEK
jgi:hypothetical protein